MKKILLQFKFFIVAFLNITVTLIPYPLRNLYLFFFGIKVPITSSIHRGVKFFHIGNLSIGKNSVVNFNSFLDNRRKITIGNNVAIGHCTKIYTLGHDVSDPSLQTKGASVNIEDNVFIFANVIIMPGVTIKEGAIIYPGSIVLKDVEPYTVVGGVPAKFIKKRDTNIEYRNNYNYFFAL